MWTFAQSTGAIGRDGATVAHGYAGRGVGKNNPAMESVKGVGPLPRGKYAIGEPFNHPVLGKFVMRLTPDPANEMFNRASFYIHGDSIEHPGLASHGCICAARSIREKIAAQRDDIEVTA